MNKNILVPVIQEFIADHINCENSGLALKKSPFETVGSSELAQQVESKKRCEKKLPGWFNSPGIYYPIKLAVEQSSSEITASYKSKLIKGNNVIDITGGFGVDSFYFSKVAKHVVYCELNAELFSIAKHNAGVLGSNNIEFYPGDGMQYIENSKQGFDTIFIDPSRRVKSQKVFFLKDCEPDVVSNLDTLLAKAHRQIIIKSSPLLDITSGLKELKHVSQVHILSIKNECKELLWLLEPGFTGEPQIICSALTINREQTLNFRQEEERQEIIKTYSSPLTYLYEPDACLLKAGCFKLMASKFEVSKLDKNTHLYTSGTLQKNFIGKIFIVEDVMDYKSFIKKMPVHKANIISRNFPLSVQELKKKHKLDDGGNKFLIFSRVNREKLKVILARKLIEE